MSAGRSRTLPWLPPPAATDIGARFLEHTPLLDDVPAGLVMALRPSETTPLAALPFRWLSEGDEVLEFRFSGRGLREWEKARGWYTGGTVGRDRARRRPGPGGESDRSPGP